MLKLKMMLCVMMLPLVVVGCIKAVCQSVREATASAWIVASPRLADTPLNRIISPSEADHYALQKQLEGTQKYINEQCR